MLDISPAPPEVERAPAYLFIVKRNLTIRAAARLIDCSHEQLRRACLPFDDADWRPANQRLRQKVHAWSGGEIGLHDWPERPRRLRRQVQP